MTKEVRWGIMGTGRIAHTFARGIAGSQTGRLIAVASRRAESAQEFGEEFETPKRYVGYEALLADAEVEAVYISTPHPMHAEWAIRSAEAGKHVLCEKPLAVNHAEAMAVVEAARANDVFLMEAFMYRCHPQVAQLVELIRAGAIGRIRVIQATFGFHAPCDETGRLLANALGGGGILDVGCYCTSISRLIAGAAAGADFAEPLEVTGCGHLGKTNVDEWAIASLRFPGDIVAQVATAVQVNLENVVRVFGSEGHIVIPAPWIPGREAGPSKIIVCRNDADAPREVTVETDRGLYSIEADTVAANIDKRQAPSPAMTWADTLGNMRTLDMWRESIGLVYEADKPRVTTLTVAGRPLAVRDSSIMKYGTIPGVDKRVSRLFMGAAMQASAAGAIVMFDHFFEKGGNAFDTAHIYAAGRCEQLLGQWVNNRGIRREVVILGKGAHTPNCTPEGLTSELLESLDRLQMDYVDIYMLHRDNPEVPIDEFVDVLNEHKAAGRIRAFGGSNWGIERIEQANACAERKGLTGFSAISNNLALARMIKPAWAGCLSSSGSEFRAWLEKTQMPIVSWSSQAGGFFTARVRPDDLSNPGLVECWYSEDNFRRRQRAGQLAQAKGVLLINIALAYVLCQPFETFAIIGPRTIEETATALPALRVELSPDELKWLNLEKDKLE